MFVIMTRVAVKPGMEQKCAALFERTNPGLVKDQPDWLGAKMLFCANSQTVTVLATWRDAEAYQRFSGSEAFQNTMKEFAEFFAGPPEVSVHAVLVDMTP